MTFRFKPEDFEDRPMVEMTPDGEVIANIANAILGKHIATLPEVFLRKGTFGEWFDEAYVNYTKTHRARLWGVEEIKQKDEHVCEHRTATLRSRHIGSCEIWAGDILNCEDCGKRLVAEWREVE